MTWAQLKSMIEAWGVPDDAEIMINIGRDATTAVCDDPFQHHKSYYIEGWHKHERPALTNPDEGQRRLFD